MSRRLQKKLQELESELDDVFRRPLDPTASDPRRQIPFDDIKQRFNFLSKLLAAEAESRPQNSDQLREIGQRLNQLEAAFCDWNRSRTCAFKYNHDDTLSICSDCTQALLHDDVVESGSEPEEDKFLKKDEREEGDRIWSKMGKYCGVFGCGVLVGAICMAVKFSSSYDLLIEYEAFLLPPT